MQTASELAGSGTDVFYSGFTIVGMGTTFVNKTMCTVHVNDNAVSDVVPLLPQTCQRDIKKLKANEMKLQQDMTSASREIARLRALVKDFGAELSAV